MLVLIIFIAFLYFYYIYSLIFIRQIHDGQLDVPIWFNKEMHFEEFQRRQISSVDCSSNVQCNPCM